MNKSDLVLVGTLMVRELKKLQEEPGDQVERIRLLGK